MARRKRILRYFGYALLAGMGVFLAFALYLDLRVTGEFEGRRFSLPARIYARPIELHAGLRIRQVDVHVIESGFASLAATDTVRDEAREGNVRGWKSELDELVQYAQTVAV